MQTLIIATSPLPVSPSDSMQRSLAYRIFCGQIAYVGEAQQQPLRGTSTWVIRGENAGKPAFLFR
jgi:hypothetical protein